MGHRGGRPKKKRSSVSPTQHAPKKTRKNGERGSSAIGDPASVDVPIKLLSPPPFVDDHLPSSGDTSDTESLSSGESHSSTSSSTNIPSKRTVRLPPIFVLTRPSLSWHKIAKEIFKIDGLENVTAKIKSTPSQIKINCPDENSFRTVQNFLETNRDYVESFSFPVKEERSLKIVIKGIPLDISDNELSNELTLLGYSLQLVRGFLKNGKRIPIHMVSLKMTENAKDIYNIGEMFYVRVKIESYKNSGPAQCFNCQHFGHSSQNCNLTPRCVKCGKEHPTKECPKPKTDNAHCCNCGGEHTANYRGCPHYIEHHKPKPIPNRTRSEKTGHQNPQTITSFVTQHPPQTTSLSNTSSNTYAAIVKANLTPISEPAVSAAQILVIIKKLLVTLQKCPDSNAKDAIINTVMSILNVIPENHHV